MSCSTITLHVDLTQAYTMGVYLFQVLPLPTLNLTINEHLADAAGANIKRLWFP